MQSLNRKRVIAGVVVVTLAVGLSILFAGGLVPPVPVVPSSVEENRRAEDRDAGQARAQAVERARVETDEVSDPSVSALVDGRTGRLSVLCTALEPRLADVSVEVRVEPYLGAGLIDEGREGARFTGKVGVPCEGPPLAYGLYLVTCAVGGDAHGGRAVVLDKPSVDLEVEVLLGRAARDFQIVAVRSDGRPAAGASIEVVGRRAYGARDSLIVRRSGRLDQDGRWTLAGERWTEVLVQVDDGPEDMGSFYDAGIDTYRQSDSVVWMRLGPGGRVTFVLPGHRDGDEIALYVRGSDSEFAMERLVEVGGPRTEIGPLAVGSYYAVLRRPDSTGVLQPSSEVTKVRVESERTQVVTLVPKALGTLRGRVIDQAGNPVGHGEVLAYLQPADAQVSVAEQRLGTTVRRLRRGDLKRARALGSCHVGQVVDGQYTLRGLAEGIYEVEVRSDAWAARRATVDLRGRDDPVELEHVVEASGGLSGTVASGLGGFVGLQRAGESSVRYLCEVGRTFRIDGVAVGDYDVLLVSDAGRKWRVGKASVSAGRYAHIDIGPDRVLEGKTLRGRVVRRAEGVAGVRVTVDECSAVSGPDGSFEVPVWPTDSSATVMCEYGGLMWRFATDFHGGENLLELGTYDVEVEVVAPRGDPGHGILELTYLDGPVFRSSGAEVSMDRERRSFAGGACVLEGLCDGEYEAEVLLADGGYGKVRFQADVGRLMLRTSESAILQVSVESASGLPVPGAGIRVWHLPGITALVGKAAYVEGRGLFSCTSGVDGQVEVSVPLGGVYVEVTPPDRWGAVPILPPLKELIIDDAGPHIVQLVLR